MTSRLFIEWLVNENLKSLGAACPFSASSTILVTAAISAWNALSIFGAPFLSCPNAVAPATSETTRALTTDSTRKRLCMTTPLD